MHDGEKKHGFDFFNVTNTEKPPSDDGDGADASGGPAESQPGSETGGASPAGAAALVPTTSKGGGQLTLTQSDDPAVKAAANALKAKDAQWAAAEAAKAARPRDSPGKQQTLPETAGPALKKVCDGLQAKAARWDAPDDLQHQRDLAAADVEDDRRGRSRSSGPTDPVRGEMRERATESLSAQARGMQERYAKADGGSLDVQVGTIVRLRIKADDRPRLSELQMPMVVLECSPKGAGRVMHYVLGTPEGYIGNVKYERCRFSVMPNMTASRMGMAAALSAYVDRTLPRMSQRQMIGAQSITGGQGFSPCSCSKTNCNTDRCKCFREGRYCTSACHRGACDCKNPHQ